MNANLGAFVNAHDLFDKMPLRNGSQLSRDVDGEFNISEVNVSGLGVMAFCRRIWDCFECM